MVNNKEIREAVNLIKQWCTEGHTCASYRSSSLNVKTKKGGMETVAHQESYTLELFDYGDESTSITTLNMVVASSGDGLK